VRTLDRAALPGPASGAVASGPVPIPAPVVVPLTPNQLRALRFSEYALDEKRRRGDPDPSVIVSSGAGEWVVRPNNRVAGGPVPAVPLPKAPGADRIGPVHTPWLTPTPRQLTDLVRGGP
jgi:hypothetical protein